MTRVEFYSSDEPKLQLACRLVANAFRQESHVVVYTPDENAARGFDKLLWTFQATGFIPHCMGHHALSTETPVVIMGADGAMPHHQVMLNLHSEAPPAFGRFRRLIELVGNDESDRRLARVRYRFYRERGYEISHHEFSASAS